ncbi:MAG: ATP-binding cassette domain-containing protein [Phycisphaeraceae bacterium]|nr:ATP-binding cassette domain-containing protein [Phycisphaeraceae bacterium]
MSAELTPGRVTAVIGPNAAGKTTLVKLLLGELRPQSGQVLLNGHDVAAMSEPARARRIAYIPQRGGVQFAFTVRQVVAMGRFVFGDQRGVVEAIERCDLIDVADQPFAQLSGGQQQRVLAARAMAQLRGTADGPSARGLLADEPTSGMDLRHQLRMMKLLREMAGEGVAVLVVLHDLNLAARYADDVWLMHEGRLVSAGPWSAVLEPRLLEPVYGVGLKVVGHSREGRPVLAMEQEVTMTTASGAAP